MAPSGGLPGATWRNGSLPMRRTLDVLRLSHKGGRRHRIARSVEASPTVAGEILRRARLYGITWPAEAESSEGQLYPQVARRTTGRGVKAVGHTACDKACLVDFSKYAVRLYVYCLK